LLRAELLSASGQESDSGRFTSGCPAVVNRVCVKVAQPSVGRYQCFLGQDGARRPHRERLVPSRSASASRVSRSPGFSVPDRMSARMGATVLSVVLAGSVIWNHWIHWLHYFTLPP
jgi:hypothetical protein